MWRQQHKSILKTAGLCALFATIAMAIVIPAWAQNQGDNLSASASEVTQDSSLQADTRIEMYRLYNKWTGEHFYTSDATEKDDNVKAGWNYEGIEWYAPKTSDTPVYRLYNPYTSDHHFTTNKSEYDSLPSSGWKQEGISWYSLRKDDEGSYPLYRQYNPYSETGTHNYTKDTKERDKLLKLGWRDEGVGWYGYKEQYTEPDTQEIDFTKATVDTANKTYTGKQIVPGASISGLKLNTDYTVTYGTNKDVGKGTITIKGKGTYTGSKTYTFNIVQKEITAITGVTASDKVYDAKTDATISLKNIKFTGIVAGDSLSVTATGAFADKNVGTNKTVNVTLSSLSGTSAKNYTLKSSARKLTLKANITAKPVMANGIKGVNKVYDGTANADIDTSKATLLGVINGETVTFEGGEAKFADKNVGTDKKVEVTGITLSGKDSANYKVNESTQAANVKASITPKDASVSGFTITEREYDGTADATVDTTALAFDGILEGDIVLVDTVTGQYVDTEGLQGKDVGNDKPVELQVTFAGEDKDNYTISVPEDLTGSITAKPVSITRIMPSNKIYDGTDVATVNKEAVWFDGKAEGDDLGVDVEAHFSDKNAGDKKAVTITINGLTGEDRNNYSTETKTISDAYASINPLEVSITGIEVKGGAGNKVYDGTTDCDLDATAATVVGAIQGDKVTATASGQFEDKNVGEDKLVKVVAGVTGDDAGNYTVPDTSSAVTDLTADITQKPVKVSGITATARPYDGTTDITLVAGDSATIEGKVTTDDLNVTATSELDNKKAGTHTVNFTPEFTGEDAQNYKLSEDSQKSTDVVISQVEIGTVTGITSSDDKTYDGTTSAICDAKDATFAEKIEGDDVVFEVTGYYDQPDAGENLPMTVTISKITGEDADNYHLADEKKTTTGYGKINQRPVTVDGILGGSKVYDQSADAPLDYSDVKITNLISSDKEKIAVTATGTFKDATKTKDDGNADNGKPIAISNITLVAGTSGDASGNYVLADEGQQDSTRGVITKKNVKVSKIQAYDKYYNGNTIATFDVENAEVDGMIEGDDVYVSGAIGTFEQTTVGENLKVTITNNFLAGQQSGNYNILEDDKQKESTAKIIEVPVKIDGITFQGDEGSDPGHRPYNGKTLAKLNLDDAEIQAVNATTAPIVEGEVLTFTADGNFETAKAEDDAKTINITNYQLEGATARNYVVNTDESQATTTGYIDPRAAIEVTVSGIKGVQKVYDGTTNVTLDCSDAVITGLDASLPNVTVTAKGRLVNKGVNFAQNVEITDIILTGDDADQYVLAETGQQTATVATVTAKELTSVSGITAANKTYDKTTDATLDYTTSKLTFNGICVGDVLKVEDTVSGSFENKNAGEDKTVNIVGIALGGDDAANYDLKSSTATTTATISKAKLTVSGLTPEDKTYDGSDACTLNGTPTISGVYEGDSCTIEEIKGAFVGTEDLPAKDVGTKKDVHYSTCTFAGTDKDNYELDVDASTGGMQASITKQEVTVQGISVKEKTYDGRTDNPEFIYGTDEVPLVLDGVVSGETLSVVATGEYQFKDVSDNAVVEISDINLSGDESVLRNYEYKKVGSQETATGKISSKEVKVTAGIKAEDREYDGTADVKLTIDKTTLTIDGKVEGDDLSVSSADGTMQAQGGKRAKDAGDGKIVSIDPTTIVLSGTDVNNYSVATDGNQSQTTVNITKKAAVLSGDSITLKERVYDPTDFTASLADGALVNAKISGVVEITDDTGIVTSVDDVSVTSIGTIQIRNDATDNYVFAGENSVLLSGIVYTGTDADNYTFTTDDVSGAKVTVNPKPITSITDVNVSNKTYDGGTSATVSGTATSTDVYSVDESDVTFGVTGAFADKKVGTGKTVNLTVTLSGSKALNYTVAGQTFTSTANIAKKKLTWWVSVNNKEYDGSNSASINTTSAGFSGRCGDDTVVMQIGSVSATFEDAEVGEEKNVTVTGVYFNGADSGNYTWDSSYTTKASITEATTLGS